MIVMSRKEGEGIVIGDGITVSVVKIGEEKVRIGIHTPNGSCDVIRGEVYALIHPEIEHNIQPASVPTATMESSSPQNATVRCEVPIEQRHIDYLDQIAKSRFQGQATTEHRTVIITRLLDALQEQRINLDAVLPEHDA